MTSLIKMTAAILLMLFAAYVIHVEPNAAQDPVGSVQRAAQRLAATCERNQEECEFLALTACKVSQFGSIGWGLVTGQGRLIYVTQDGRQPYATGGPVRWSGPGNNSSGGSGDYRHGGDSGLSITGLINGSGGGDGAADSNLIGGQSGGNGFGGSPTHCP